MANVDKFWLVWNGTSQPPTKRHQTIHLATEEAMRLAGKHQAEFFVLEVMRLAEPITPLARWRNITPNADTTSDEYIRAQAIAEAKRYWAEKELEEREAINQQQSDWTETMAQEVSS